MRASEIVQCAACLIVLCGGCAPRTSARDGLQSRYPLDRAIAAVHAAERGDASAIHRLVELLDDSDRAVRMYSINALVRLTGRDYGYRHYEPDEARAAAVGRWRDALRRGDVSTSAGDVTTRVGVAEAAGEARLTDSEENREATGALKEP